MSNIDIINSLVAKNTLTELLAIASPGNSIREWRDEDPDAFDTAMALGASLKFEIPLDSFVDDVHDQWRSRMWEETLRVPPPVKIVRADMSPLYDAIVEFTFDSDDRLLHATIISTDGADVEVMKLDPDQTAAAYFQCNIDLALM